MSSSYLADEGEDNTPYFLIPSVLVAVVVFFVLPIDLFLVVVATSAISFYAHGYFDKAYHVQGSKLARFAWFRHKQQLHFVHHLHANSNFAVIDFFWDRLLGTYQQADGDAAIALATEPNARN